jgi:hypothetical protein
MGAISSCRKQYDPDYFRYEMRVGDIIKKCTEISWISNNITEIYQR